MGESGQKFSVDMSVKEQSDKLKRSTKLLHGVGDAGNASVNSFAWIAGSCVFNDTMDILTSVPYLTLIAELTDDYDECASLTALRLFFGPVPLVVLLSDGKRLHEAFVWNSPSDNVPD